MLDPKGFQEFFSCWVQDLSAYLKDKIVAIDGITGRGSHDKDNDPRIREQALALLTQTDKQRLKALQPRLLPMLLDPSANIRQAAVRLLHHINEGPAVL